MNISISSKLKNILLILMFLSICFFCDVDFFSGVVLILFPYFTCSFEDSLGYYLYQTSEIYRIMYNNREITTCVLGCLYFLFFRCYVFQKWVYIIENKCQGLFLHDFLIELRKNKQILLYANIVLLLITIATFDFCRSALKINYICSFIFVFPFHYLILYIRWAIKDKNIINKSNITTKYHIIQYVNSIFLANFMMIVSSSFWIFLCIFANTIHPLYIVICYILVILGVYGVIYSVLYYLVYNIKLLIMISTIVIVSSTLLYCDLMYEVDMIDKIISYILRTICYIVLTTGILSSLFTNQIAKLVIEKQIDTSSDLSE